MLSGLTTTFRLLRRSRSERLGRAKTWGKRRGSLPVVARRGWVNYLDRTATALDRHRTARHHNTLFRSIVHSRMELRRLDESDLPAFVDELYLPFAREMATIDDYNELTEEGTVREESLAYRRDQLSDPDTRVWVAESDDGALAGYACASLEESAPIFTRGATLSLAELYVVPDHRGDGVADALFDRAAGLGRERDCERLGLSMNAENERARAFYERRGLEPRRLKLDRPL